MSEKDLKQIALNHYKIGSWYKIIKNTPNGPMEKYMRVDNIHFPNENYSIMFLQGRGFMTCRGYLSTPTTTKDEPITFLIEEKMILWEEVSKESISDIYKNASNLSWDLIQNTPRAEDILRIDKKDDRLIYIKYVNNGEIEEFSKDKDIEQSVIDNIKRYLSDYVMFDGYILKNRSIIYITDEKSHFDKYKQKHKDTDLTNIFRLMELNSAND